ncbi:MAG TPA: outer membrane protein assembly factor BamD [Nitrospirota bacterium]|nr:outer membrane protein assembly factor BamD [Nitrospirota bacterium]
MKKILFLLILILLAGCSVKEPPFDPVLWFKDGEANMRGKNYEKARKKYQEIEEKSPDRSYDAVLMLRIADTYYGEEKYSEALVEYKAFLNYHPVHKDAAYAQYQIAMCSYNDLTSFDRDPAPAYATIREMKQLLEKYPKSGYGEQAEKYIAICTDWIADYELYVARFYYKKESYKAALGRCEKLLSEYPGSSAEKDALYYAGLSYQELGEMAQARAMFETLAEKYPAMKKTALAHIQKLKTL